MAQIIIGEEEYEIFEDLKTNFDKAVKEKCKEQQPTLSIYLLTSVVLGYILGSLIMLFALT